MKTLLFVSLVSLISLLSLASWTDYTHVRSQEATLLKIASEYEEYVLYPEISAGLDSNSWQWTQTLCKANLPTFSESEHLFFSAADAKNAKHGDKLYQFFIKDHDAYITLSVLSQPVGQALVKETWDVIEYQPQNASIDAWRPYKRNENDGKNYTPSKRAQLFVMYKEAPSSSNDDGWVYGVVDLSNTEGQAKVLEKGQLQNCMSCHKNAKYDRIIGRK